MDETVSIPATRSSTSTGLEPASGGGFDENPEWCGVAESPRHSPRQRDTSIGRLLIVTILFLIAALAYAYDPPVSDAAPVAGCRVLVKPLERRACIIRRVFGRHGGEAVRVFYCESRLDPNASNGQFKGIAQMGERERARFGHGRTVLAQARAAKRYHDIAGWSPWTCA